MPEMSKERNANAVSVNTGDLNVDLAPAEADVQKDWTGPRNDDLTLPLGAYTVQVTHADPRPGQLLNINGQDLEYGSRYSREAFTNKSTGKQDFVGQITIVSNGTSYLLTIIYPSDNPFDPSTLD